MDFVPQFIPQASVQEGKLSLEVDSVDDLEVWAEDLLKDLF